MEQNKRQDPRIEYNLPVSLKLPSGDFEYETEDISLKGLFLQTPQPLPLQKLVRFKISLPARQDDLQMLGLVAHTINPAEAERHEIDPGMGIRIFSVGAQQKEIWEHFVQKEYEKREESRRDLKHRELPTLQVYMSTQDELEEFIDEELSRGNTFIPTSDLHEAGTRLLCNLIHPDGESQMQLEAKVVDIVESPREKRGIRVAFQESPNEDTIDDFV